MFTPKVSAMFIPPEHLQLQSLQWPQGAANDQNNLIGRNKILRGHGHYNYSYNYNYNAGIVPPIHKTGPGGITTVIECE